MNAAALRTGLDIGTTKVCAVVVDPADGRVVGCGVVPSAGLRRGVVVNMDETAASIARAVEEAGAAAGVRIRDVAIGITGSHISSCNSTGAVALRGRAVTAGDREQAITLASTVYIPLDREVLKVIPTDFSLDDRSDITDPVGMRGVRLEARTHIITACSTALHDLVACCGRAGVGVSSIDYQPLAAARAVLTEEERQSGVLLLDIGGGTTDIVFFRDGTPRHASVIGIGGAHITADIAVGLRISTGDAERLKVQYGAAYAGRGCDTAAEIALGRPDEPERTVQLGELIRIIQPRCEEIGEAIGAEIGRYAGIDGALAGVVMTGGASRMPGFVRLAEAVLGMPVRVGVPVLRGSRAAALTGPDFAAAAGLVCSSVASDDNQTAHAGFADGVLSAMMTRMKAFLGLDNYQHA